MEGCLSQKGFFQSLVVLFSYFAMDSWYSSSIEKYHWSKYQLQNAILIVAIRFEACDEVWKLLGFWGKTWSQSSSQVLKNLQGSPEWDQQASGDVLEDYKLLQTLSYRNIEFIWPKLLKGFRLSYATPPDR